MNATLARIAKEEARKNYHGDTDSTMGNLHMLAELFQGIDGVTLDSLNIDWSGAFAFLCATRAGLALPARYPDPRVRASFASVYAWEDYARLPKIRLWHTMEEIPQVGDLVLFEHSDARPPRIGIVLSVNLGEETVDLAVGNHRNHSAIIEQPLSHGLRGFIRFS